jgi:hypothetical protein
MRFGACFDTWLEVFRAIDQALSMAFYGEDLDARGRNAVNDLSSSSRTWSSTKAGNRARLRGATSRVSARSSSRSTMASARGFLDDIIVKFG